MPGNLQLLVPLSCALLVAGPTRALGQTTPRDAARIEFFEKKIRPVLANNCYNCHSANTNAKGGLRVDDRNGLLQGGGRGPAVVPGQPDMSLLLQAIRHTHPKLKMPPKKQLSEEQLADLAKWIQDGAAWPAVELPASIGKPSAKYARLRKNHWAWQPLREARVPPVRDTAWPRGEIDRFLLARLEERGLRPVRDADRATLLRRLTFDLTGLPPTPAQTETFVTDRSPAALEKVVDRLLASPAFGERWGRHWLDVARYGESTGSARNLPYPHAWRYRDWVIDAFNSDKPYDQFLREQLAGDLLPASSQRQRDQQLIATGFLALGVRDVNQRFKVRFVMDNVDEQIDTVTRAVLGLTVSCARCHNHKFDPIPTTDYYALAGIFRSTDLCAGVRSKMGGGGLDYYDTARLLRLGSAKPYDPAAQPGVAEKIARAKKAVALARAEFQALAGTPKGKSPGPDGKPMQMTARLKMVRLQKELLALTDPAVHGPVALGVRDAQTVSDTEIRIRGEAEHLGPVVPRGFLSVLDVPDAPKVNPRQSGRLELAQWLTSPRNPLTPRVLANRVWQHLFGAGLVRTVDNFGVTGDEPSHPELLDYLAARLVREGWSVKKLVRALVLSRAYQLGTETSPAHLAADPANRLVWRHSPRRLAAEEIRDAMLAAAGTLNLARPQGSPAKELQVIELPNNSPLAKRLTAEALKCTHRSVYLPLVRGLTPRSLEVFDFAEQGMVTGSRDTTTVATQALYLLNDPFVERQALALAGRLLRTDQDDAGRIRLAYRLAVGRAATSKEVVRTRKYLADYEAATARGDGPSRLDEPRSAAWASFCHALLSFGRVPLSPLSGGQPVGQVANLPVIARQVGNLPHGLKLLVNRLSRAQAMLNPQSIAGALGGRMTRRHALKTASAGFGYLALAGLLGQNARRADAAPGPLAPREPHFRPRARRIIFLFMEGAMSQLDTWEHKPQLQRDGGHEGPGGGTLTASRFRFRRHGQTGTWVSELFPNLARHVDKFCFLRGLHTDTPAHPQAVIQLHTGTALASLTRPSMGAWLLYGLGTENQDLPGYVTVNPAPNFGGAINYGSAFLPAHFQGTRINDNGVMANLRARTPPALQRRQLDLIQAMNRDLATSPGAPDQVEGVIQSYELAFRMQTRVPELLDISREPRAVLDAYGVRAGPAGAFARQCLMARRLSEAGVRFVEICQSGWDHHSNLHRGLIQQSAAVDRPAAALLDDLERRGLLDETLVLFGSEFGRMPTAQGADGRDHNITGYPMWLAGAGVKKGFSYGGTDEYGLHAVAGRMHTTDLHATLLALMGLDHRQLTYRYAGRDFRLTDVAGNVATEIFA